MKKYIDILMKSMVEHDPSILPLADTYAATENAKAAALSNMTCWRTITGLNYIAQCFEDKQEGQVFATVNVDESGMPTILFARLKIEKELIAEIELGIIRSRADSGFVYLPDEMNTLPSGWTSSIPEDGRATRKELYDLGKAVFDASGPVEYETSADCILMEIGGIVYEDPDYLSTLNGEDKEAAIKDRVTIPAGLWPGRPQDPNARVVVVDEAQGVVISMGSIEGYVCPYIVTNETSSCFVPACMIEQHRSTLNEEMFRGKKTLKEMPASSSTVEIVRYHSGKVQGMHRYIFLQGPRATSPWVS